MEIVWQSAVHRVLTHCVEYNNAGGNELENILQLQKIGNHRSIYHRSRWSNPSNSGRIHQKIMPKYDAELMLEHRISMHLHFSDFQLTNSAKLFETNNDEHFTRCESKQKKIDSNSNSVSFSEQTNGISANDTPNT